MPKITLAKKTRRAANASQRAVDEFMDLLRRKSPLGAQFMAKVTGMKGDGRFTVKPITAEGDDVIVHLSGALRIKKGNTHKNVKAAVSNGDNVLVDGDTLNGVFSQSEAAQVRKYLKLNNNSQNALFERPPPVKEEQQEENDGKKKTKKRKTYRK